MKGAREGMDRQRELEAQMAMENGEMGMEGPVLRAIEKEHVLKAQQILQKYKQGKANLERRIIENEQWYKLRNWNMIKKSANAGDPEPTSAWLFNCIANKHADAMDNFPNPNVLPREEGDETAAKQLTAVLPVVLEQNRYEQVYSDTWWYKLKAGTSVTGVFWDTRKQKGLGDIDVRKVDLLNLFWEPGITDIQKSRNLFHVDVVDNELLEAQYPALKDKLGSSVIDVAKYSYDDTVDTSEKSAVVDWYYKKQLGTREVLHYVKFCVGEVLFASENEPEYAERGFYDHGEYPFVMDTLFPEEGTPVGFGYVDVCKSPQMYIDKLDQVLLKTAVMAARPRFFIRGDGMINEAEYADWEKDFIHYLGSGNPKESIQQVDVKPLPGVYVGIRNNKIEELKETSGNRDFSQGGTAQGVTAASAIAALQEAGSKLSRDMIKTSYRAFSEINMLIIELIRQFYDEPRYFRIIGEKGMAEYVQMDNAAIRPQQQGSDFGLSLGMREPVFDIRVTSQKSSPFSTVAQNERAKELYGMGFFNPQLSDQALAALEMMDFEAIDKVRQRVAQNGTLLQLVQQLQAQMAQMAMMLGLPGGMGAEQGMHGQGEPGRGAGRIAAVQKPDKEVKTNALGEAMGTPGRGGGEAVAAKARIQAASATTPRA